MQKEYVDEFLSSIAKNIAQQTFKLSYIKEKKLKAAKTNASKEIMQEFQVQIDAVEKDIEELESYKKHIEEKYG